MKKFVITSAALLMFAGSTLSVSAAAPKKNSSKPAPAPTTNSSDSCPPNQPDGCGIYT